MSKLKSPLNAKPSEKADPCIKAHNHQLSEKIKNKSSPVSRSTKQLSYKGSTFIIALDVKISSVKVKRQ